MYSTVILFRTTCESTTMIHNNSTAIEDLTVKVLISTTALLTITSAILFFIYVIVQTIRKRIFFRFITLRLLTYLQISAFFSCLSDVYVLGMKDSLEADSLCYLQGIT